MTRKTKKIIHNIFACILLFGAISWVCEKFIHLGNVEFTENAQVKQLIVPVNSRVQGFIKEVRFDEYTRVSKGDTLVVIEDAEYRYRVAQAEANLANAITGKVAMHNVISTTNTNLSVTDANIGRPVFSWRMPSATTNDSACSMNRMLLHDSNMTT